MKLEQYTCLIILSSLTLTIASQTRLSLEDAILERFGKLAPERVEGLGWTDYDDEFTTVRDNELWITDMKEKERKVVDLATLNEWGGLEMKRFPSVTFPEKDKFYFRSGSNYYMANVTKNTCSQILELPPEAQNVDFHFPSRSAAYTFENNLYMQGEKTHGVTNHPQGIVAGQAIARWEFGISGGTFFSPDGSLLAFYEKDERHVSDYPLVDYSGTPATLSPTKYPMAGSHSEYASVGVYDPASENLVYLNVNDGTKDDTYYTTNLSWTPDGKTILIAEINRAQNEMSLNQYDAKTGEFIKTIFTEKHDKYVEPEHAALFLPNSNSKFIWQSERSGYNGLYLYNLDGELISSTSVFWPITSVLDFDQSGNLLYVQGTGGYPTESHLFAVDLSNMVITRITNESGVHRSDLSPSGRYFLDQWSNLQTPGNTDLISTKGNLIKRLLESKNPMEGLLYGRTEIFDIEAADGTQLWCRLIKPTNFDPNLKYPVLVYVYNGPHVQLVDNRWMGKAPLWMNHMAEEGYLVFTLDGRGSANRGLDFEQAVFRQMGTLEIEDQKAGVEWLKAQSFVDSTRMAVHGWSYGGFMTISLMLRSPELFQVGVAGGPVIDWNYYEVMYTERYMDTPEENPEGYDTADLKNYVRNLQGDLLVIHGTADPTVVMQHSMSFLKTCVDEEVQVDFFAYPGHPHNVRGKDRVHLMKKVLGYIMERL